MPANVSSAGTVTDNYPFARGVAFQVIVNAPTAITEYLDGSSQRRSKANTPRRSWSVSHRLKQTDAATLRTFWKAHLIAPFNFKDTSDGVTRKAVFAGAWNEQRTLGNLYIISLELVEVV